MKNKLMLTALAAAMVAPGVAMADGHGVDVTVGGVVQVYLQNSESVVIDEETLTIDTEDATTVSAGDVRIAVGAEKSANGYTGYASYRIDSDALSGNDLASDNITVGIKGDFGDFAMGETWKTNQGEFANDIYGFTSDPEANLGYKGSFGPATVVLSWSPEDSNDMTGLGVEFGAGPVTIGAATETYGDTSGDFTQNIIGAKAGLGPVNLAAHYYDRGDLAATDSFTIEATTVDVTVDDFSGYALQVDGSAANWSWKVTYASESFSAEATAGAETFSDDLSLTTTRLDLGTTLMDVVGFTIRYSTEDNEIVDETTSSLRAGLEMSF